MEGRDRRLGENEEGKAVSLEKEQTDRKEGQTDSRTRSKKL